MNVPTPTQTALVPVSSETALTRGRRAGQQGQVQHQPVDTSKQTGAQPLNSQGRGQLVNLLV